MIAPPLYSSGIRRPTENAAIRAAARSPRRLPPVHVILADMVTAHAAGDRHGIRLCACLLVRATTPEATDEA
ncbi:MAG TPA: hypothetical protein VI172_15255 [Candidatus Dormibacteraeota bacterium]